MARYRRCGMSSDSSIGRARAWRPRRPWSTRRSLSSSPVHAPVVTIQYRAAGPRGLLGTPFGVCGTADPFHSALDVIHHHSRRDDAARPAVARHHRPVPEHRDGPGRGSLHHTHRERLPQARAEDEADSRAGRPARRGRASPRPRPTPGRRATAPRTGAGRGSTARAATPEGCSEQQQPPRGPRAGAGRGRRGRRADPSPGSTPRSWPSPVRAGVLRRRQLRQPHRIRQDVPTRAVHEG